MTYPNIFLIGFMGSGKSHWGKIWSEVVGIPFADLDAEIEKAAGMKIEEIFEKQGEKVFRTLEKEQLRKFEKVNNHLVACGGGTPCFHDNMAWMLGNGLVIYLKATPQYILSRVMDEREKRPLLKRLNASEVLYFIEQKLNEREPFYEKAHQVLDVEQLGHHTLSEPLKQYLARNNTRGHHAS